MKTKELKRAECLADVSAMADNALLGGTIDKDQHAKIKEKVRELEFDALFSAMANYCNS